MKRPLCALSLVLFFLFPLAAQVARQDPRGITPMKGTMGAAAPIHIPPKTIAALASGTVLLSQDFESTTTGWVTQGIWQIGAPSKPGTSVKAHGGNNCAVTSLTTDYPTYVDDTLFSPTVTLPTLGTGEKIKMTYWQSRQVESGYDYGQTLVSTDAGATWTKVNETTLTDSVWNENVVDISTYAGQNVMIGFHFHSDGSVNYAGWYIDDFAIVQTVPPPLETKLLSLNSQQFPTIYMNVAVNVNGAGYGNLVASNFQISEDGIPQTGCFDVTPPSVGGGVRAADVVFLVDNSGSMDPYQASIRSNMNNFVTQLAAQGVDLALGLVRFGQSGTGIGGYDGDPILVDNGVLTSDTAYFKNTVWAVNTADGGTEPGYWAISKAIAGINFRPGAQRIFIILTDEEPTQNGRVTVSDIVNACTSYSVTLFAITVPGLNSYFDPITAATNGAIYDFNSDYSPILNAIASHISNTYVIRYCTANTTLNGVLRNVGVVTTYNTYRDTARGSYTPGQAPNIVRTPTTVALGTQPQLNNQNVTIAAEVTDNVSPYVQGVTLYYRTTGTTTYTSLSMSNGGSGSIWSGIVPAAGVVNPGIDYYLSATDGQSTTTDPDVHASTHPYQIAILPNVAPRITHTPITSLAPGVAINVRASIVDNTLSLASCLLYCRKTGQLLYQSITMTLVSDSTYQATIPDSMVTTDGVDYFIVATDNYGLSSYHGRSDQPHQIGGSGALPLRIVRIWDFPNDNGRWVWIQWRVDVAAWSNGIQRFNVEYWDAPSGTWANVTAGGISATDSTVYQTKVMSVFDSTKTLGMFYSVYRIVSFSTSRIAYSAPDSGYSLDNLSPGIPSGVTILRGANNTVELRWNQVTDDDLFGYVVYRSLNQQFTADATTKIGTTTTEYFLDNAASSTTNYYYKITSIDHSGNESGPAHISTVTGVEEGTAIPLRFELGQNYPNPFNPSTTISYSVPTRSKVQLVVYNTLGEQVAILAQGSREAGRYSVSWEPGLASGVYYYRFAATADDVSKGTFVETRKMILVK